MTKKALAIYLILISTAAIWGQGYSNIFGKFNQFNSTRSLGLGGAGLASESGPGAVFLNPALMSLQADKIMIRLAVNLSADQEERSIRVFDSFDSYLTDEIYAMQKYSNSYINSSLVYPLPVLKDMKSAIGIGFSKVWDFNYDYEEQLRNPDPFSQENRDVLFGYNILQSSGAIFQIPIQFSIMPLENIYVSAGISVLSGDIDQKKYVNAVEENNPPFVDSTLFDNQYQMDGAPLVFNFAFAHVLNKRFTYALRIDLPYTMKFKGGYYYEVPTRLGAGFDYRAKNLLMARLNFDVDYRAWSKIKQKWSFGHEGEIDGNPEWRDAWTFKVGIEHFFHEDFPFRIGFNYDLLPQQENQNTYLVTAGTGISSDRLNFEMSGGMGSRSYIHSDLFPNSLNGAPDRTGENVLDKVKDIYYELMFSVTYLF